VFNNVSWPKGGEGRFSFLCLTGFRVGKIEVGNIKKEKFDHERKLLGS
jgi:hypothetical protein